jgi:hypothetical protein
LAKTRSPQATNKAPAGQTKKMKKNVDMLLETARISSRAVYAGKSNEAQLAALQKHQGPKNNCAPYSIASALQLLSGRDIKHDDVARRADRWTILDTASGFLPILNPFISAEQRQKARTIWQSRPPLRTYPNFATRPIDQAHLAIAVARDNGMTLKARPINASLEDLKRLLKEPHTALLVTLTWTARTQLRLEYRGSESLGGILYLLKIPSVSLLGRIKTPAIKVSVPAAHTMFLAAHDPATDKFGFVNSWADGGKQLYWIAAPKLEAHMKADRWLGLSNNTVVLTYTPPKPSDVSDGRLHSKSFG